MSKNTIFIALFFFSYYVNAQQHSLEKSVNKKDVTTVFLNKKFLPAVLNAYQVNSKSKIEDTFNYFQILTDSNLSRELKKEVIKNIYLVFKNKNELIIDFTSDGLDKIPLQQFLQKLLISESILFSVMDETDYSSVDHQSWKTSYTVIKTKLGVTKKFKVIQTVFMQENIKQFGKNKRLVYEVHLGKMD